MKTFRLSVSCLVLAWLAAFSAAATGNQIIIGPGVRDGDFENTKPAEAGVDVNKFKSGSELISTWQLLAEAAKDAATSNDTGFYTTGNPTSRTLFIQPKGGVINVTEHTAKAGDIFVASYKRAGKEKGESRIGIYYQEGVGATRRDVLVAEGSGAKSTSGVFSVTYRVLPGSPLIGRKVALGFRNPSATFVNIDDATLEILTPP